MHDAPRPEKVLPEQNIIGTIEPLPVLVTPAGADRAERSGRSCGYVAAKTWRYGAGDPFCNAPAVKGSSYCARHRARCAIAPASEAGTQAAAALLRAGDRESAPPAEFAYLVLPLMPELEADAEPRDIAGCLDVPAPDGHSDG